MAKKEAMQPKKDPIPKAKNPKTEPKKVEKPAQPAKKPNKPTDKSCEKKSCKMATLAFLATWAVIGYIAWFGYENIYKKMPSQLDESSLKSLINEHVTGYEEIRQNTASIAALEKKVIELEKQLNNIKTGSVVTQNTAPIQTQQNTQQDIPLQQFAQDIAKLSMEIASLKKHQHKQVDIDLSQYVTRGEIANNTSNQTAGSSSIRDLYNLRDKLVTGQNINADIARINKLYDMQIELPDAIKTRQQLAQEFTSLADSYAKSESGVLGNFITIRPVHEGGEMGNIAKCEKALKAGDIAQCLEMIGMYQKIDSEIPQHFANWSKDAGTHLKAIADIDSLINNLGN